MKLHMLVIEDDKKIAGFIKKGIEDDSFQVTLSYNGEDGLKQAMSGIFDLVVLDVRLPKRDGYAVLHELREAGFQVPVIMLTAKAETADIVAALDAGADGYMSKPFSFAELKARANAFVRRTKFDRGAEIRYADVRVDPVNHRVWRGTTEIILTSTEYNILSYFVRNPGVPHSRQEIVESCWDVPINTFSNIIDVYINYLRHKFDDPFQVKLIHTVRGKGYIFETR